MTDKSPSEQAYDLLAKWNPPPVDHTIERVVGVPTNPGDVAATAHVPHDGAGSGPSSDSVDAQRAFADDLDGEPDGEVPDIDDTTVEGLKEDLKAAGKPVSGNKQELYDRLYNEPDEDDDDEDEDEDDES
jgi:hypothetical protein